jgi:hypothetical protein
VYPSGAARATAWTASSPPAPARFSITKVAPSGVAALAVISRASVSDDAPGAKGTIRRMGRAGQASWACSRGGARLASPARTMRRRMAFLRFGQG